MAAAGVVAVLLPGAFLMLRETQAPPIDLLRRHGVRMAVATDCNPGTSPLTSPLLAMNLAATLFRMTVDECIAGFTREAARALGRSNRIGRLAVGLDRFSAALDEELQAHVKRRLSAHAYPRLVEFVTELPKTPSGKIQRFLLRKAEVEKLAESQV